MRIKNLAEPATIGASTSIDLILIRATQLLQDEDQEFGGRRTRNYWRSFAH